MIDFPNSPTTGQLFSSPTGTFSWDDAKWVPVSSTAFGDAPSDGTLYGRQSSAWARIPFLAGDMNLAINGNHDISQQNGNASVTGGYVTDQWLIGAAGAPALTAARYAGGPPGFSYCLRFAHTNAVASLAAGDVAYLQHPIEGVRWQRTGWGSSGAVPVTIGFWILCNVTGNLALSILNTGATLASYVVDVPIAAANTWQWFTVTVPPDTVGSYAAQNFGRSLALLFSGCAGSTYRASAPNTWLAGQFEGTPNTMNLAATANNFFQVTGLVIVPGTVALPAAMGLQLQPNYDDNFRACMRYWQTIANFICYGYNAGGNGYYNSAVLPVVMRAAPSAAITAATYSNASGLNISVQNANGVFQYYFVIAVTGGGAVTCTVTFNARM
jgi:hypothetical protein